jgi:hypothetical protein
MNEETQKFLDSLTEEDVKRIRSALKTYTRVETLAWWLKAVALTALAAAISITQFGDAIKKIIDWFK